MSSSVQKIKNKTINQQKVFNETIINQQQIQSEEKVQPARENQKKDKTNNKKEIKKSENQQKAEQPKYVKVNTEAQRVSNKLREAELQRNALHYQLKLLDEEIQQIKHPEANDQSFTHNKVQIILDDKTENAFELVKKMNRLRAERDKREKEYKVNTQLEEKKVQEMIEKQKQEKQAVMEEKRKNIQQKLKAKEEIKKRQQQQQKISNKLVQELVKKQPIPIYSNSKMERFLKENNKTEQFTREINSPKEFISLNSQNATLNTENFPQLAEKKRQLAEKRNVFKTTNNVTIDSQMERIFEEKKKLFKPVKAEELDQFGRNCEQELIKRKQERENKRKMEQINWKQKIPKLEHNRVAYLNVKQEEQDIKKKDQTKLEEAKTKFQKRKQYGKIVKEQFHQDQPGKGIKLPKVTNQAMIEDKDNGNLNEKQIDNPAEGESKQIQQQLSPKTKFTEKERFTRLTTKKHLLKYDDIDKRLEKESQSQPQSIPLSKKYQNYLLEANNYKQGKKIIREDEQWKKIINDNELGRSYKYEYISANALKLQQKAKIKEDLSRLTKKNDNIELQEEIDALYLDSIKAKLALLDELDEPMQQVKQHKYISSKAKKEQNEQLESSNQYE